MNIDSCDESKFEKDDDFTQYIPQKLMKALTQCIECGKCVGICTAARVSNFNSRKIVKMVLEHNADVLKDENLWKCFLCHYCWMVCPKKDMDLPELIFRLREISIQLGYAPEKLKSLTDWLEKYFEKGKIAGPNQVSNERLQEIKKVAETSGVNTLKEYVEKLPEVKPEVNGKETQRQTQKQKQTQIKPKINNQKEE